MSNFAPPLIVRRSFDATQLMTDHPPSWRHPNKSVVYRLACPRDCVHTGQLHFSRWQAPALPDRLSVQGPTVLEPQPNVFGYDPAPVGTIEWYLNFAHWDLFCSYGGGLFAQDEMQVAEHPILGALREALVVSDIKPFTVDLNEPTPVLIRNAERRIAVATEPNAAEGRPHGLYGNRFMAASANVIERACRLITPPTRSNILAMEAPTGSGVYTQQDIRFILRTALTGFAAARLESDLELAGATVVIHTGFWGCGAYGGNRVLMALLQLLAAKAAGIDRLVFHTVDTSGLAPLAEAAQLFERDIEPLGPTTASDLLVLAIQGMSFEWGVGDGN